MYLLSGFFMDWLLPRIKRLYENYSVPRSLVFALDNLSVFVVFLFAYLLRFNFQTDDFSHSLALEHALLVLVVYMIFSLVFRSFAGLIRHTTIVDMVNVFLFTSTSFALLMGLTLTGRRFEGGEFFVVPISILIIHYFSITLFLFFVRFSIKTIYHIVTNSFLKNRKVLVFGAGETGVVVKRVIDSDVRSTYQIVGFIDDKKSLQGKKFNGIPVYSPHVLSRSFIERHKINVLIFAVSKMLHEKKTSIMKQALDLGLEILEAPAVEMWLDGHFQVHQIRKINVEDLLGRSPIQLNMKKIGTELRGRRILVTGAAGSIGSEIVRQLARFDVGKIILVDQAETPMFHLGNEINSRFGLCPVEMILADITNLARMEDIFQSYLPEIVFHAAAYKHVPLMEENPHEAVRVNVGGTRIMTGLSMRYGVRRFVLISTDKSVNPTNIMGVSKCIGEKIVQLKAGNPENTSQFIVTRFGNVLGSNGSVIPTFRRQIEEGGPVTVTHPEMTRYFMTIPEACQLVLEAGIMGKGGEIFVFDMGDPVKIVDLASQMIRLSGFVPGKDIKIVFVGLRPGEKLYEELLADSEKTKPTFHPKIMIARAKNLNKSEVLMKVEYLLNNLYSLTKEQVVELCCDLVPEYHPSSRKYKRIRKPADVLKADDPELGYLPPKA